MESDAFVNRCRDLIEVCESRKQLASVYGDAEFPVFGMAGNGEETRRALADIRKAFLLLLQALSNVGYSVLRRGEHPGNPLHLRVSPQIPQFS